MGGAPAEGRSRGRFKFSVMSRPAALGNAAFWQIFNLDGPEMVGGAGQQERNWDAKVLQMS